MLSFWVSHVSLSPHAITEGYIIIGFLLSTNIDRGRRGFRPCICGTCVLGMLQCSDHLLGQVKWPRTVVRDLGGILEVESRVLVRECQFRIGSIVSPEGRRRSSLEFYVRPRDHAFLHHFRYCHCWRWQCGDQRVLLGRLPTRCRAEATQRRQSLGKSATLRRYCSVLVVSLHHGTCLL